MAGKKKPERILVDGVETSELKFSKLQEFAETFKLRLDTAKKDKIFLQAQCSYLKTAWETTNLKLQQAKDRSEIVLAETDKNQSSADDIFKEMDQWKKHLELELQVKEDNIKLGTQKIMKDIEAKWEELTLKPLLKQKADTKLKIEEEFNNLNAATTNYQETIDKHIAVLIKDFETKRDSILQHEIRRLNRFLSNLKLTSDTAFFRTQEEYNRIIRELLINGNYNYERMREFYQKITEDDIILIMVLEKQVKKLKAIVKRKEVMCKKINEQTSLIDSTKGELDVNLGRAQRKMKLYDTNMVALDKTTYFCDLYQEACDKNVGELSKLNVKEMELRKLITNMNAYINQFHVFFETRQNEICVPLMSKIKIINSFIHKDDEAIKKLIETLPTSAIENAKNELKLSKDITVECLSQLMFDLSRLTCTHNNLINFMEASLAKLNIPQDYRLNFKRINVDSLYRHTGPIGELITKYPFKDTTLSKLK